MTRASLLPRRLPLLLAAALVALLAVLFVQDARPAAADHDETTIWSATLNLPSGFRLCNDGFTGAQRCSSALTDNTVTFRGVDYRITVIGSYPATNTTPGTVVTFDKAIPPEFQSFLTLRAGSTQLRLSDATLSSGDTTATWSSATSLWSAGDTVQLSMTQAPLTAVTIWSATLNLPSGFRLCNDGFTGAQRCSSALTDNTVTFRGVDYRITVIGSYPATNTTPGTVVTFDKAVPPEFQSALTFFHVGSTQLRLSDATLSSGDATATWSSATGLWSAGDTVQLSMTWLAHRDANLSALTAESSTDGSTFSALDIGAFADDRTSYSASVPYPVTHARLTPTVNRNTATVSVNRGTGTTIWSATLNLPSGNALCHDGFTGAQRCSSALTDNTVTFRGVDYRITVIGSYPATNSIPGTVVTFDKAIPPEFQSFLTLHAGSTQLRLSDATLSSGDATATWSSATSLWSNGDTVQLSMTVHPQELTSGTASAALALSVGDNPIIVRVTAEDGSTRDYTVTIRRAAPDTTLSALTAESSADLSTFSALNIGAFRPGTTSYRADVLYPVTHARLTPTANASAEVTLSVNGATVTSGTASAAVALGMGDNPITVRVTGHDGSTRDYTVTVHRLPLNATEWRSTLNPSKIADDTWGCRNGVPYTAPSGLVHAVDCSDTGILSSDTFNYNRIGYGRTTSSSYRIHELYIGPRGTTSWGETLHELVLTTGPVNAESGIPPGFTLTVNHWNGGGNDGVARFKRSHASVERGNGRVTYRWPLRYDSPLAPHWGGSVELSWAVFTTGLDTVRVHYDGYPEVWSATLTAGTAISGIAGSGCGTVTPCSSALTDDTFTYDNVEYTFTEIRIEAGSLSIRLNKALPQSLKSALTLHVGNSQFPLANASSSAGNYETWSNTGLSWSAGDTVQLRLTHTFADGFIHWRPAGVSAYYDGLIAYIPKEFTSVYTREPVLTTHAKLKLSGSYPGSTIEWGKGTHDRHPATFNALAADGFTDPIELETASNYTHVYVRVTNDDQTAVHRIIIDPPPRTYSLTPQVGVNEGEDAQVTLTLGSPATSGGVTFDVTAAFGDGGATPNDVGAVPATVTVPEGETTAVITIPTIDDAEVEDLLDHEERFTVSVAHSGQPAWAVDPEGTATSVVTIIDNDEPPGGPEPWNIEIVPGDGTLTVTWRMGERPGWEDADVRHALRWSQVSGVWANPRDPRAVGANDGVATEPGSISFVITGLENDLPTGVFVRSFPGNRRNPGAYNVSERNPESSEWVRVKDERTTPRAPAQQQASNSAPTVDSAIADATIVNASGTQSVSLSGAFADADNDSLTVTAASSDTAVATTSVSADYSTLTVTAKARGTATITVTASDGNGGTVSDEFTITVKAAPVVASAIDDVSGLEVDATQDVSLSGVFTDADGDDLTVTAESSDTAKVTVSVASDGSKLTLTGVAAGTATVTVTARDTDGNEISDEFEVAVAAAQQQQQQQQEKDYSALIAKMWEWRNDPDHVNNKEHTDRWDRALLAFGETLGGQDAHAHAGVRSPGLRRPRLDPLGRGCRGAEGDRAGRSAAAAGPREQRPHGVLRHHRRHHRQRERDAERLPLRRLRRRRQRLPDHHRRVLGHGGRNRSGVRRLLNADSHRRISRHRHYHGHRKRRQRRHSPGRLHRDGEGRAHGGLDHRRRERAGGGCHPGGIPLRRLHRRRRRRPDHHRRVLRHGQGHGGRRLRRLQADPHRRGRGERRRSPSPPGTRTATRSRTPST